MNKYVMIEEEAYRLKHLTLLISSIKIMYFRNDKIQKYGKKLQEELIKERQSMINRYELNVDEIVDLTNQGVL